MRYKRGDLVILKDCNGYTLSEGYALIKITKTKIVKGLGINYEYKILESGGYDLYNPGSFWHGSPHYQVSTKINSIEEWKAQAL